jgi:hypothetical protein
MNTQVLSSSLPLLSIAIVLVLSPNAFDFVYGQSPPVCGNARLSPSTNRTSVIISWFCDRANSTDITDPRTANISVSVTDRTRNVDVALSNADFDIVGPMSISINGRYGQPVQGDDFLYRITLSLSSTDQNVMFSGRFRLVTPPPNGGMRDTQVSLLLVATLHLLLVLYTLCLETSV